MEKNSKMKKKNWVGMRRAGTDSWLPRVGMVIVGVLLFAVIGGGAYYLSKTGKEKMVTNGTNAIDSASNSSTWDNGPNASVTNGTISTGN